MREKRGENDFSAVAYACNARVSPVIRLLGYH